VNTRLIVQGRRTHERCGCEPWITTPVSIAPKKIAASTTTLKPCP
jgi:hypothetical protein